MMTMRIVNLTKYILGILKRGVLIIKKHTPRKIFNCEYNLRHKKFRHQQFCENLYNFSLVCVIGPETLNVDSNRISNDLR